MLLRVDGLRKWYPVKTGTIWRRTSGHIRAVDDIGFEVGAGQSFGLVGESGCGKSTTARLILGLEEPTAGSIQFSGVDVQNMNAVQTNAFHRSVQAVFQDPTSALNPRMRVRDTISEPMVTNRIGSRQDREARVGELLDLVGLPRGSGRLFPHEFSGGQRQRIAIARALTVEPRLIVLDEPVSALDVSVRAQVLNLLMDVQEQFELSYLLISHDLATVRHVCDMVGVMYLGRLVELASTELIFTNPAHPYTATLLAAIPRPDPSQKMQVQSLEHEIPSASDIPPGCRFHPRCAVMEDVCRSDDPKWREVSPGHWSACHFPERVATMQESLGLSRDAGKSTSALGNGL